MSERIEIVVTGVNPAIAHFHARALFENDGGEVVSDPSLENRSLEAVAAYGVVTIVVAFGTSFATAAGKDAWEATKRAFEKYRETIRDAGGDAEWDGYL